MTRKPFGERNFMEAVLKLAAGEEVWDPVPRLGTQMEMASVTVRKYIEALAKQEFIQIIHGDRWKIAKLKILKHDLSKLENCAPRISDPKMPTDAQEDKRLGGERLGSLVSLEAPAVPAPKTPIANTPEPIKPKLPRVAALFDFDNLAIGAERANIKISWVKLKENVRRYGRIVFADAYLSPSSTTQKVISELVSSGWRPVYCPMRYKDKDSVDYTMTSEARKYLTEDFADIVVIASRDADFRGLDDFASDQHKMVIFLQINDAHEENPISVAPPLVQKQASTILENDREINLFEHALDLAIKGKNSGPYNGPKYVGFIRSLLIESSRVSVLGIKGFEDFANKVYEAVRSKWGQYFTLNQTKSALKVFFEKKVLRGGTEGIQVDNNSAAARAILDPTAA